MLTGRRVGRRGRIKIPIFKEGDTDHKLRCLCKWATKNLPDNYPLTLDEIGLAIGLTRERIRQIESKALRKCRHPVRVNQLDKVSQLD